MHTSKVATQISVGQYFCDIVVAKWVALGCYAFSTDIYVRGSFYIALSVPKHGG